MMQAVSSICRRRFLINLSFSSATGADGRRDLPADDRQGETIAVTQGDRGRTILASEASQMPADSALGSRPARRLALTPINQICRPQLSRPGRDWDRRQRSFRAVEHDGGERPDDERTRAPGHVPESPLTVGG
jgi:hypothetical protein